MVQGTVILPGRGEVVVSGRVVYKDLKDTWDTWKEVLGSPMEEVPVALTILPSCCKEVPVRVMNLASYPVTLRQGTVLGELELVEVVDRRPSTTSDPHVEVAGGHPDYMILYWREWTRRSRLSPDSN